MGAGRGIGEISRPAPISSLPKKEEKEDKRERREKDPAIANAFLFQK
jgi:hypothetical protein